MASGDTGGQGRQLRWQPPLASEQNLMAQKSHRDTEGGGFAHRASVNLHQSFGGAGATMRFPSLLKMPIH